MVWRLGEGQRGCVECEVFQLDGGELFGLVGMADQLRGKQACVERVPDPLYTVSATGASTSTYPRWVRRVDPP